MKKYLSALSVSLCVSIQALTVGVTAGPHADIVNKIKEIAKGKGLMIDIVEFNDFIMPNEALNSRNIDINSYQHEPFLKSQVESRGYQIRSVAKTVIMPLGVYSSRIKSLDDLPEGGKIAIPNDPTNGGRAFKLLAKAGVIQINDVDIPGILDMTANPKNLSLVEIEAPLVPQSLPDVDAGITNTDWILTSGLDPKSAIIQEGKDSPYANVIAIRIGDENRDDIKQFVDLYHSPEIKDFIETTYKGAVIPAWEENQGAEAKDQPPSA